MNLYREAVDEATKALTASLEEHGLSLKNYQINALARAVIMSYLVVASDHRDAAVNRRISPLSRALSEMQVHDVITVAAQPSPAIRNRCVTARQLMENPDARFSIEQIPGAGRVKITRLADSAHSVSYYRDPRKNLKAVELASIKRGESIISKLVQTTREKNQLGSNDKLAARKILNDPTAQWRVKTTPAGILITRTD